MAQIDLTPLDFITVGTVGPKGKRQFNLQGGDGRRVVTLTMEKEQARRLAQVVTDLLDEITKRLPDKPETTVNMNEMDMDLRDPIEPEFRVGQMGIGFDESLDVVVLEVRELVFGNDDDDLEEVDSGVVRFGGSREQFRALAIHTQQIVDLGRPDPKQNGYTIYYWA